MDSNGPIIASVSGVGGGAGSDALTKSINLELSCGFLPLHPFRVGEEREGGGEGMCVRATPICN